MQLPESLATFNGLDSLAWLLLGACSQSILTLFLPTYVSFLPIATLLAVKARRLSLPDKSSTSPTAKALKGRYTAQIPHENGSAIQQGADTEVVVFVIGACSSQYVLPFHDLKPATRISRTNSPIQVPKGGMHLGFRSYYGTFKACGLQWKQTARIGGVRNPSCSSLVL